MPVRALFRICLAFSAVSWHADPAAGQSLRFDHLDMRDGLSQSSVHAIVQDASGFIWFGTEDGLNRFDGQEFTVYRHDPLDPTSLSSNIVIALYVDPDGNMWIASGDGIDRYDRRTESFIHYGSSEEGTRGRFTRSLDRSSDGTLWASTDGNGLLALDPETGLVRRFVHDPENAASLLGNRLYTARVCGDDLWVSSLEGLSLLRLSHTSEVFDWWEDLDFGLTYDLHCTDDGHIWLAASGGLFRGRGGPGLLERVTDEGGYRLSGDGQGGVWVVTTNSGLSHVSASGNASNYRPDALDPNSLTEDLLNAVYRDDVGTIWVGSASKGVSRTHPLRQRFRHIVFREHLEDAPGSSFVTAAFEDEVGDLWVGTSGGLYRAPAGGLRFERAGAGDLSGVQVHVIRSGPEGELMVGLSNGLCIRRGDLFSCYDHDPSNPRSLPASAVRDLLTDRAGASWVATRAGLARFVPETDDFDIFDNDGDDERTLSHDDVRKLLEDHRGDLWVGTINGLNRFRPADGTFVRYMHEAATVGSLPNPLAWALLEDTQRRLWVGTLGGLALYDPETDRFIRYGTAHGLPNEVINCIQEDGGGNLWISTNRGLSRLGPFSEQDGSLAFEVRSFTTDDGLQAEEFHSNACHRLADGRMIFGGVNGLNIFHPDSIRLNQQVPPVVLTGLSVMARPWDEPVGSLRELRLPYDRNFFTISFAALDFVSPRKNQHAYMLEGLDREWIDAGARPQAVYTSVPPGRYTFRARGSNGDGVWNEAGVALPVVILPPFWQTWWFRLLTLIGLAALVAVAYNVRVRRLLAVERMRLRIASDLHDDIGASLGSIILLSDMVQRRPMLEANDRRRLQTITKTAREMADDLREIVWIVTPENDRLGDLIERMRQAASSMLDGIPHSFVAPDDLRPEALGMDFRRNVLLIFKEILHNVQRHAEASQVEIEVREERGNLLLRVVDDGRGFSSGSDRAGHGLKSMQRRAEQMGGRLVVSSEPGAGTNVSATFPYHANA